MSTYLGIDVLPVMHNMRETIAESFARSGELLGSRIGATSFDDHAGLALPERTFQWTCPDRSSCDVLRAFLDARRGRRIPFWAPTCCPDLPLVADAAAGLTLDVRRAGYSDLLFALGPQRRYVAIFPAGGSPLYRKVVAAAPTSSTVDQLTLDATTGVDLASSRTVISFLVLCRLADDFTEIEWYSTSSCEAALRFVELPREVPA